MPSPIDPLVETLRQLETVVASLTPRQYAEPPAILSDSSIGSHVRHCLEHVEALLAAVSTGVLDYDDRRRGTEVETSRRTAIETLRSLQTRLADLKPDRLGERVVVRSLMTPAGPPIDVASSLGRELAYVTSHTTHHNAIIGFLVRVAGGAVPDQFGYAPSTLA
ncbi:MAG TPA: DinB family protein, partial [Candidatus Polarisedimenticolia bacterium]|nr:DinB family protein [Candidatus Polarisedimenticolia bacterium]